MIQKRSPDHSFSQIGPKSLPEAELDPKNILGTNFWGAFWEAKSRQNRSKIDQKTHPNREHAFCQLFDRFCLHFVLRLGALWPPEGLPKMHQKSDLEKGRGNIFFTGVSRSPPYRL